MHLRNSCERSTSTCCIRYSPGADAGRRRESRDLPGLLVVEGDVGDQVADHRERPQRRDGDHLVLGEGRHPGHAQQPRPAVDLGAARAALAGLAVPAHRQVAGLGGLQPVDDVEDDLALVDLDGVVLQLAAVGVAAPHPEPARRSSWPASRRCRRCRSRAGRSRAAPPRSGTSPARPARTGPAGPAASAAIGCSRRPSMPAVAVEPSRSGCRCRHCASIAG